MQGQIDDTREDIARLDEELAVLKARIERPEGINGTVTAGGLALIIETFFA
jgi:hypothetical protein